ncbi:VOC family protein [Actinomycetospora endophytica]|uniref:VOC family protein n=1 Tax=Actinomycetospora endophytica TaxID=2291215 RepID=A0ABS8P1G1_9PSEU|nr:VOC family protein [Actinomycetospora endophytica]MCD2191827.1 VOC family protein [Actinomycetospora endophytica]
MAGVFGPVVNVFLFVDDLETATAWYAARLGRQPVATQDQLAMFELGERSAPARLTVHRSDEYNEPGLQGTVAYWDVEDVDAFVAEWTRNGAVAHRGPKTVFTGERLCQLRDPFGNLIGIRQAPV